MAIAQIPRARFHTEVIYHGELESLYSGDSIILDGYSTSDCLIYMFFLYERTRQML